MSNAQSTETATIGPIGSYDTRFGRRIDGSAVAFFGSRASAIAAAKRIGWPIKSIVKAHTRFQAGYALAYHFREEGADGLLAKAEFERLRGGQP